MWYKGNRLVSCLRSCEPVSFWRCEVPSESTRVGRVELSWKRWALIQQRTWTAAIHFQLNSSGTTFVSTAISSIAPPQLSAFRIGLLRMIHRHQYDDVSHPSSFASQFSSAVVDDVILHLHTLTLLTPTCHLCLLWNDAMWKVHVPSMICYFFSLV